MANMDSESRPRAEGRRNRGGRRQLIRGLCSLPLAAALSFVGLSLVVAPAGATTSGPLWAGIEGDAQTAISSYTGEAITNVGSLSGESDSSFVDAQGSVVSVEERSFAASIGGEQDQVTVAWLGGQQAIVTYLPVSTAGPATSLVLAPRGSSVDAASQPTAVSTFWKGTSSNGAHLLDAAADLALRAEHRVFAAALDDFVNYGGCEEYIDAPQVEGSVYGPLIYGLAGFVDTCSYDVSVIGGLYENGVGLNDTQGASGIPNQSPVGITAFSPCYLGGPNSFSMAAIYTTPYGQYGASRGDDLYCA